MEEQLGLYCQYNSLTRTVPLRCLILGTKVGGELDNNLSGLMFLSCSFPLKFVSECKKFCYGVSRIY